MLMTLFKWQAKILNRIFKTERYDKLIQMQVKSPDEINYSHFFDMTPGLNPNDYMKVIEATNRLCRPSTRANIMQQQVIFLNQYLQGISKQPKQSGSSKSQSPSKKQAPKASEYKLEHVVIYSSLSKCRIWPKVLKSGIGFVPILIQFYNSFTKQYGDWLDFKFDPVILTQKYTKIMKKVNMKKRDHPKLIQAIKTNNIQEIDNILKKLEQENREKYKIETVDEGEQKSEQKEEMDESSIPNIINNISHKSKAISHICCQESDLNTIKHLYELGADFQMLDDEKQTALFFAVKRGKIQIVKFLVEVIKVNINHREYQNRTALYLASFQGDIAVVDYLYKNGADPQLCSKLDRTPLSKACYLGNIEVVKYLLSIKVDILKQDNKGRTALHNAVWGIEGGRDGKRRGHIVLQDSPECAQLLLKAGHPIDLEDYDGFTPFFSAVSSNAVRSVRLLHSLKADIFHKTKNKENAVFIAAKYGHLDVLKILINEYKLNYTEPDYHGYSPLCASVTLQTPQVFFYFCDLYAQSGVKFDISKIIECCRQYGTIDNLSFPKMWLFNQSQTIKKQDITNQSNQHKVRYLYQQLSELILNLKKLKKQKREMKKQLHSVNTKRGQFYKLNAQKQKQPQKQRNQFSSEFSQKLKKQKLIQFERTLKEQQQQMTEQQQFSDLKQKQKKRSRENSRQKVKTAEQVNRNNAFTAHVTQLNKHLETLRKMIDFLLVLGSHIIVQAENLCRAQLKLKNLEYNEQNMQIIRTQTLKGYNLATYRMSIAYLLSECVHMFNKGKRSQVTDLVGLIQQLAKALNINKPAVPPFGTETDSTENKMNEFTVLANQTEISLNDFCRLRLNAHQSQSDLNKLLGNKQIETNLVRTQQNLIGTLFRLARNRKSGTIIYLFNKREGIGKFTHEQLVQIIQSKGLPDQLTQVKEQQNVQTTQLTLIQYCLLHGISDMAVFLQQVCKLPHLQMTVKIHPYSVDRKQLSINECNIDLEPVKPWVFNLKQVLSRMSQKQVSIYSNYLNVFQSSEQNKNNKNQIKFISCNNYVIVDTKQKLQQMERSLEKSVLIGIDVEYYGYSKQEYFICSIQIANGQMVHILDPMSHLSLNQSQNQESKGLLTPQLIAEYMRRLMSDENKVKIFHAYENDVKWLHEDFDLGSEPATANTVGLKQSHLNNNVIDTSRIYNFCNKVKKGESVGLRTLCSQYLNYQMDKNFQRSDWRIRPLFKQMVQYASIDAEVLPYIFLMMLEHSQGRKAIDKIKQLFCSKRNMKGKGIRNILVHPHEKAWSAQIKIQHIKQKQQFKQLEQKFEM